MADHTELPDLPHGELGIIALDSISTLTPEIDRYIVEKREEERSESIKNGNSIPSKSCKESYLLGAELVRFSDGEGKCVLQESIRGKDIYVIGDIGNYSITYPLYDSDHRMGPDEHFQDIKRVVNAIGGKAWRVTVIMPRLYASRQDKRGGRESLDCAVALQELHKLGVCNILTFDAHNTKVQNAIPLCGFESVPSVFNMLQGLVNDTDNLKINSDEMLIISPDSGAMDRAVYYANVLDLDVGLFYKRRDLTKVVDGKNPIVRHEYVGPEIKGKDILIVDDMIASGGTMFDLFEELKERGAKRIYVCVTFALFTKGIEQFETHFKNKDFTKIFTSNLSYIPPEYHKKKWLGIVDMSRFIGKIIHMLNYDRSISPFFDDTPKINELLKSQG
jgi:ribose-phosphate pyrophosphokinase